MNYKEHVAFETVPEEQWRDPIFVDFLSYEDMRVYEEVTDTVKLKKHL